jgi:hypothetical protein
MNMMIWVYEGVYWDNEDYMTILFERKEDAQEYTIDRILIRLQRFYQADQFDSEHKQDYKKFLELVKTDKGRAINYYNDWVDERPASGRKKMNCYEQGIITSSKGDSKLKKKIHYPDGAHCKKCNELNQYVAESNQDDGTYLCGTCKALSSVFGS